MVWLPACQGCSSWLAASLAPVPGTRARVSVIAVWCRLVPNTLSSVSSGGHRAEGGAGGGLVHGGIPPYRPV